MDAVFVSGLPGPRPGAYRRPASTVYEFFEPGLFQGWLSRPGRRAVLATSRGECLLRGDGDIYYRITVSADENIAALFTSDNGQWYRQAVAHC